MAEDYESESFDSHFHGYQIVTTRLAWITMQLMSVCCCLMVMVGVEVSAYDRSVIPLVWENRSTQSDGLPTPLTSLIASDTESPVNHCAGVDSQVYPNSADFQSFSANQSGQNPSFQQRKTGTGIDSLFLYPRAEGDSPYIVLCFRWAVFLAGSIAEGAGAAKA